MIFLRIRHRFHERASEWFCAANMVQWGATLLHPSPTFVSPSYVIFDRLLGEQATGLVVGGCGMIWLVGLIINGSLRSVTSSIRAVCAFVGAMVYGLLALGFVGAYLVTNVLSTGIGNYALVSILALYSLYWIMRDTRASG